MNPFEIPIKARRFLKEMSFIMIPTSLIFSGVVVYFTQYDPAWNMPFYLHFILLISWSLAFVFSENYEGQRWVILLLTGIGYLTVGVSFYHDFLLPYNLPWIVAVIDDCIIFSANAILTYFYWNYMLKRY